MSIRYLAILTLSVSEFLGAKSAFAWDPVGDLTHPERIVKNVEKAVGGVGNEIERVRREAAAQSGAPAFEQWLIGSRNTASNGAMPIPNDIRRQLSGYIDEGLLNRVRYKVGDRGVINLAGLSIQYGEAEAVTLIDVVVFKNRSSVRDPVLWAHELKHVEQFRDWGVRDFSIRYLRDWNAVEGDAYAAADRYATWRSQNASVQFSQQGSSWQPYAPPAPPPPSLGSNCATPAGICPLNVTAQIGSSCYCQTYYGVFWGYIQ